MKYREALKQWQRAYVEQQLEKADGSVTRMAAATGLNSAHIYKFCNKLGVKVSGKRGRCIQNVRGNAAFHALSDEALG